MPRPESGFGLIELMIGGSILAIAMLAYGGSMLTHRSLAEAQHERSSALIGVGQFMERLRADDDWAGLYDRCRLRMTLAEAAGGTEPRFTHGSKAWTPTTYFPDFQDRTDLRVLIRVPVAPDKVTSTLVLREDVAAPAFLLPMDLDGDGVIDDDAKDASYKYLPVVVFFLWTDTDGLTREFRITTMLRGAA